MIPYCTAIGTIYKFSHRGKQSRLTNCEELNTYKPVNAQEHINRGEEKYKETGCM